MVKRDSVKLPKDKNDRPIDVGDRVFLKHNKKIRKVTSLMLCKDGSWIVGCDAGGCFILPESKDNVTLVDDKWLLKERLREVVLECVTVVDTRNGIPVLGCDDTFLDDWFCDHEGELVLGETYQKALDLVEGLRCCNDDEADAMSCPLYDKDEPYRCRKERYMEELGIGESL